MFEWRRLLFYTTLNFPGGLIVGDAADFLNVSKIKWTHNALFSGIYAAEAIFDDIVMKVLTEYGISLKSYNQNYKRSNVADELYLIETFMQDLVMDYS